MSFSIINTYKVSGPYWKEYKGFKTKNKVCDVYGLKDNMASGNDNYEHCMSFAPIDCGLVNLVTLLNKYGLKTNFCCSGITADHIYGKNQMESEKTGYIYFDDEYNQLRKIKIDGLEIERGGGANLRIKQFTEGARKYEIWRELEEFIKKITQVFLK